MPTSYRAAQKLIKRDDEPALLAALDAGLDPNLANENGWSLFMLAAVEGSVPLGRLLLARGAEPAIRNVKGETASSIASARQHAAFLALLAEQQAE